MTLGADMAEAMREFLDGPKRGQAPEEVAKEKTLLECFLEGLEGDKTKDVERPRMLSWQALEQTLKELNAMPKAPPVQPTHQQKVDQALANLRKMGIVK